MDDLTSRVFTRLDARLNHTGPEPVALALSGGGDSMALLDLAAAWAKARGRRLLALTVDHNLNPDSAAWTRFAAEAARAAGADWRGLLWTQARGGPGVPARARAARHALLAQAAREAGARVILTGHTADDVAEGEWMRAEGATLGRLRDWSASPVWPQGRGLMLLRPVLEERRETLRDHLRTRGLSWLEDPANGDLRYGRGRARAALAQQESPVGLSASAAHVSAIPKQCDHGWAGVLPLSRDLPASTLAAVLLCAGGGATPPRGERLAALQARLAGGEDFTAVLCGARIEASGALVRAMREPGEWRRRPVAPLDLTPGVAAVWDGRFEIVTDRPGLRVEAAAGRLAQLSDRDRAALCALPPAARAAAPVLIDSKGRPRLAWRAADVRALGLRRLALASTVFTGETTQEDGLFQTLHGETPPSDLFSDEDC
ncbi:tRNA lysidine(34) synthetase TilS [Brevundimonas diminuta]|uniref:tRNA lysidine(34) synthetase TilS n=1 Tax=Brevundimonas diminuta TaxID=293 RepID=UPI00209814D6|nr:tRNA lysidine(34) synthetase TilS [Brevundimonas diminuta]MCO8018041.1 tRNA lysidine(34) synthetase TilS [Brevundimonas diminuta]MCO8022435.1 tRNA lysidine(34) synthetase TilS [Brevundimonas diminuta]